MKRLAALVLTFLLAVVAVGCADNSQNGKIKIVTTVFPQYDWVKNLTAGADNVEVTLLSQNGVDIHSFQPSTEDILKISTCDLFVYVGGESDKWVNDLLKNSAEKNINAVSLSNLLTENGGGSHTHHSHGEGDECKEVIDEHVWLSVKNAQFFCTDIANRLCELDGKNKELYQKNLQGYLESLKKLDTEYKSAVENSAKNPLVFADRFPFIYLLEDYGIKYFAAFEGCSADSEADFDTVFSLAARVDEYNLKTVLVTDNGNLELAKSVINNTRDKNCEISSLSSMQTVKLNDRDNGVNYLKITEDNLKIIKKALGE